MPSWIRKRPGRHSRRTHRGSGRPAGTAADLPTKGIPHRNSKQRHVDIRGVCQCSTGHSGGLCRRHQPDNVQQHPNGTSGFVHQPLLQQGGGKHGTADGYEEPLEGAQKPEVRNVQPQEIKPTRWRRRRLQRKRQNVPQVEKIRTVPPTHLVEHHVLLEPWGGQTYRIRAQ